MLLDAGVLPINNKDNPIFVVVVLTKNIHLGYYLTKHQTNLICLLKFQIKWLYFILTGEILKSHLDQNFYFSNNDARRRSSKRCNTYNDRILTWISRPSSKLEYWRMFKDLICSENNPEMHYFLASVVDLLLNCGL